MEGSHSSLVDKKREKISLAEIVVFEQEECQRTENFIKDNARWCR